MKGIGRRIKALRESRGWDQRKFAERAGVTQPAVWFWELDDSHPKSTKPSPKNLHKLAKLFGVTPQWLLFGGDAEGDKRRRAA